MHMLQVAKFVYLDVPHCDVSLSPNSLKVFRYFATGSKILERDHVYFDVRDGFTDESALRRFAIT
jgi:hypothetical protein